MESKEKKVLIVEDNKDFLWILRQSFSNEPLEVVYAEDGQEALDIALQEKPDLIMMDIDLPKMNGIEASKKIREHGLKCQIIFLTNLTDTQHITSAIEAVGETDYIIKADMRIDEIVQRVRIKLGVGQ